MLAEPWELILFGVVGGAWAANKLVALEDYYEGLARQLLLNKMDRNHVSALGVGMGKKRSARAHCRAPPLLSVCTQGVLEEKYVDLLGSSYERIMGDVERAKTGS